MEGKQHKAGEEWSLKSDGQSKKTSHNTKLVTTTPSYTRYHNVITSSKTLSLD